MLSEIKRTPVTSPVDRKRIAMDYVQQNCDALATYAALKANVRNVLCNKTLHCLKDSLRSKKRALGCIAL